MTASSTSWVNDMNQIASVYSEAIYGLAQEENITDRVMEELSVLKASFLEAPDFLRLLGSPNIPKEERTKILDDSFSGKVHPFVLNFLKILTEKNYISHFPGCCEAFRNHYNRDKGIIPVSAVTAVPMTETQKLRLQEKLGSMLGKKIDLTNRIDPNCLGGMRLDFDGKQLDDTVANRLRNISELLTNTVL